MALKTLEYLAWLWQQLLLEVAATLRKLPGQCHTLMVDRREGGEFISSGWGTSWHRVEGKNQPWKSEFCFLSV